MKLEKPLAIPPIFGQSLYPDTDLPPVSILKYQGLKGVVLSHIMATDPNTDVRPLMVRDIQGKELSDKQKIALEKARLVALQTLSTIGQDILERNLTTFIVTRQIRPLTKDRLARRKSRKNDSEESDNAFALSKGWLTVPQAAKRFPFTEGAIRHMIFQAEAYVRVKKRPSKASSTKKKPYVPDGFLDVIVRIPNKRRVFLDEKKFAAWMSQSQGA
ncbi:MAG: hypothetical protein E6Q78_12185 [Rhodoferax sp.]|nr:MAG: hypothetical protein E6Q78_12185 [Rhodoferax sp.]